MLNDRDKAFRQLFKKLKSLPTRQKYISSDDDIYFELLEFDRDMIKYIITFDKKRRINRLILSIIMCIMQYSSMNYDELVYYIGPLQFSRSELYITINTLCRLYILTKKSYNAVDRGPRFLNNDALSVKRKKSIEN